MNGVAVLALLGDLYSQIQLQQKEVEKLQKKVEEFEATEDASESDPLGGTEEAIRAAQT